MPAQGRDRGSERRPEPSKGASRNLRTPLNRPNRGETTRFRAIPVANGPRIRPQRPPNRLHPTPIPPSTAPSRLATLAAPGRWKDPRVRAAGRRMPAVPLTPLPLAPLPRNRHRPRTRSVATPRSHLDCRNVLILIVAGHTGGFRQDVHDLLCRHPELVSRAAHQILSEHFPPSIHQDILEAVRIAAGPPSHELDEPMPRRGRKVREYTPRDRRFRKRVLEAYEERCAVCEYDIRFGDRLLGLEAAHIRWHSHDGRDVVRNGLALCSLHHKALDRGAMGLDANGDGFRILISGRVRGRSQAARRLVGFGGRGIRGPVSATDAPDRRFVAWHREEVFRS